MEQTLRLETLGRFECQRDGKVWQSFESDKARALLVYLAVESGSPHRRGHLAGLLWPDKPEQTARHSLSQALYTLRSSLDSRTGLFELTPQTVLFDPTGSVWVDIRAFWAAVQSSEGHCPAQNWLCQACIEQLESAAALYQGEFLAGFNLQGCEAFEAWLVQQRESLHQEALRVLALLASAFESRGDPQSALRYAQRWSHLDEFNEEAFRQVMHLLAELDLAAELRQQYRVFEQRLAQELAIEPEAETHDLYQQINARINITPAQNQRFHFPHPLTPIVGRQDELDQVTRQLAQPGCRILTILGPGGVGKSRLAVEAGLKLQRLFRDGVCLVELDTQSADQGMYREIAQALGLTQRTTIDLAGRKQTVELREQVSEFLNAKNVLFVLDGFEGLLDQAGDLHHLLQHAPDVKALITSRARPNIKGETILFLDGLPLPLDDGSVIENPSVQLFLSTARRVSQSFRFDEDSLPAVVEVCRLTHGLPLGILLSAAWSDILTPNQILKEIHSSLDFLSSSWRDLPERQRSLRATFDHSWRLLAPDLQTAFLRLSVFQGAFAADRAQGIAGASLSQLKALVGYCLLQAAGENRYRLHDLLRQYAQEKLSANLKESRSVRERHCTVYMEALAAWEPRLKNREQFEALVEIDSEIAEVLSAWDWATNQRLFELLDLGARALDRYCILRGRSQDGIVYFRKAINHMNSIGLSQKHQLIWVNISIRLAHCLILSKCYVETDKLVKHIENTLRSFNENDPKILILCAETCLLQSEINIYHKNNRKRALELSRQSVELLRACDDPWTLSLALYHVSMHQGVQENKWKSVATAEEALSIQEDFDDPELICLIQVALFYAYSLLGLWEEAIKLAHDNIPYYEQVNTRLSQATSLVNLGIAYTHAGYFQQGLNYFAQARSVLTQIENQVSLEFSEYLSSLIYLLQGNYIEACEIINNWVDNPEFIEDPLLDIVRGYLNLVKENFSQAKKDFSNYVAYNFKHSRLDMISQGLALLAYCAYRTKRSEKTHQFLVKALENGIDQGYFIGLQVSLFVIGLILAEGEALEPAEALKSLAEAQFAEKSVLFDELFGRRIAARTAALPEEQLEGARTRGREMDLFEAAAAYLEKLKGAASLDAFLART